MDRVLVGATIGVIIGGLLGTLASNLDAGFQLNHPGPGGGSQTVNLTKVVVALAIVFGAGAGGIIGAIAGAVSARPDARPLPAWFWWVIIGLLILVVILGVFVAVWAFLPSKSPDPGRGPEPKANHLPNPPPDRIAPKEEAPKVEPAPERPRAKQQ
jgi:MFS family permease